MNLLRHYYKIITVTSLLTLNIVVAVCFMVFGKWLFALMNGLCCAVLLLLVIKGIHVMAELQKDHYRIMNEYVKAQKKQELRKSTIAKQFNDLNNQRGGSRAS